MKTKLRKANRLKNFDYNSKNMYFVTFCTRNKMKILSEIISSNDFKEPFIKYSELGFLCNETINKYKADGIIDIPHHVIMPNHVHMIIDMTTEESETNKVSLPNVVKGIKSISKNKLSDAFYKEHGKNIWQKSYYDRIIRDDKEYYELAKYIEENPLKWELDEYWAE